VIEGVGTDIVDVRRMAEFIERHGDRGVSKILSEKELAGFAVSQQPAQFLAKRFAAKEAVGKAFGTGLRAPLVMPAIAVVNEASGKPSIALAGQAASLLQPEGKTLRIHLSLSDEREFATAFVVLESV
jgi:holo-[acyl-carrier protein] synthase